MEVWNEMHAIFNSELTSMALVTEKAGELARAIARKQAEPQHHHHDAPNPPLSDEIAELLWEILSLSAQSGIDLTEALAANLEKRNQKK